MRLYLFFISCAGYFFNRGSRGRVYAPRDPQIKKVNFMNQVRSRWWSLISYENPETCMVSLFAQCKSWIYIYHDKDNVESHYHILVNTYNAKTSSAILSWCRSEQNVFAETIHDKCAAVHYLTHDNSDKATYSPDALVSDNLDFWLALSRNDDFSDDGLRLLSLIDDFNNPDIPLRVLVGRYGRDFVYHYKDIEFFASLLKKDAFD